MRLTRFLPTALALALAACGAPSGPGSASSGLNAPTANSPVNGGNQAVAGFDANDMRQTAETAFNAPDPIPFDDSIERAGKQLIAAAKAQLGAEARSLVIDPLIDANTGAQTRSTVKMGTQLEGLIKEEKANWQVKPLTRDALAKQPLLMIGTLTPVNVKRAIDTKPDAFRVWLTIIDLRTNKVIAKQIDRATADTVDAEPLKFFQDSPTWAKDETVQGYINSCQVNTKVGDLANEDYLKHLPAAAVINEAMMAYNSGKVPAAHNLYKEARSLAAPGDLRVLNGLYLTSWQLGKRDEALNAFGELVSSGLNERRLPLKLTFKPGGTAFSDEGELPAQYPLWVSTLAEQVRKSEACVRVVGHTSRSGNPSANEKLSLKRAEVVANLLERQQRSLRSRLTVQGAGSREALVGLGSDDKRDALDRRVEFKVVDCV